MCTDFPQFVDDLGFPWTHTRREQVPAFSHLVLYGLWFLWPRPSRATSGTVYHECSVELLHAMQTLPGTVMCMFPSGTFHQLEEFTQESSP